MQLPKYYTTVTPLSKTLAMIIFISLPFVGFYLGQKYKVCDVCPSAVFNLQEETVKAAVTPTLSTSPGKVTITDNNNRWGTYENSRGIKFNFPPKYQIGYTGTDIYNQDYFTISIPSEEEMMPGTGCNFYVSYNPSQKNLVEYVAVEISRIKDQHTNDPRFKIINEKTVKYGNNTAYQFTIEASQSPLTDEIYLFNYGVGLHISETGITQLEHSQIMNSITFTNITTLNN